MLNFTLKNGIKNYNFVHLNDDFDYVILINRALTETIKNERLTCFQNLKVKNHLYLLKVL